MTDEFEESGMWITGSEGLATEELATGTDAQASMASLYLTRNDQVSLGDAMICFKTSFDVGLS